MSAGLELLEDWKKRPKPPKEYIPGQLIWDLRRIGMETLMQENALRAALYREVKR